MQIARTLNLGIQASVPRIWFLCKNWDFLLKPETTLVGCQGPPDPARAHPCVHTGPQQNDFISLIHTLTTLASKSEAKGPPDFLQTSKKVKRVAQKLKLNPNWDNSWSSYGKWMCIWKCRVQKLTFGKYALEIHRKSSLSYCRNDYRCIRKCSIWELFFVVVVGHTAATFYNLIAMWPLSFAFMLMS